MRVPPDRCANEQRSKVAMSQVWSDLTNIKKYIFKLYKMGPKKKHS
jgi:hypothetical protein